MKFDIKELIRPMETFIWVKETKNGIETNVSQNLKSLPEPIKAQIKAFLENVIKGLK